MARVRRNPYEIVKVAPREIDPPHGVTNWLKYYAIRTSLAREGWNARPLLVEFRPDGTYQAWTGSHRIAAARETLETVPVVVVDSEALDEAYGSAEGTHFDVVEGEDPGRQEYLESAGDEQAAALMGEEVGARASNENPLIRRILPHRRRW